METIASFKINHDTLTKGVYISRIDGDIVTYDIRMKLPNNGDFLSTGAAHTIEHLFATYARNTKYSKNIIYVGPMGCRTGFYFLVRDKISNNDALKIVVDSMNFIKDLEVIYEKPSERKSLFDDRYMGGHRMCEWHQLSDPVVSQLL